MSRRDAVKKWRLACARSGLAPGQSGGATPAGERHPGSPAGAPWHVNTYKSLVRPWLYRMDPERAHHLAERLLSTGFPWWPAAASRFVDDPRLAIDLGDLHLPNPVGLAPGFDKNGRALPGTMKLGFGYVSVGSVLPGYRAGN